MEHNHPTSPCTSVPICFPWQGRANASSDRALCVVCIAADQTHITHPKCRNETESSRADDHVTGHEWGAADVLNRDTRH